MGQLVLIDNSFLMHLIKYQLPGKIKNFDRENQAD
jgi:hypothetical protein